jgi:predicted HAD superfamily phosphohydrolase
MKWGYRYKLLWLNIPLLSVFGVLLSALEAFGEEKLSWVTQTDNQLVISLKENSSRKIVSTSARDLLAQQSNLTRVTGIELKQTESGLEVILKTVAGSQKLVPLILPEGNNLVVDLLDATLALPTGNEFREIDPAPGIREVQLIRIDKSSRASSLN